MSFAPRIVCVGCWNERNPQRPAPAHVADDSGNVEPDACGWCGKTTTSGIFVKMATSVPGMLQMVGEALAEAATRLNGGKPPDPADIDRAIARVEESRKLDGQI